MRNSYWGLNENVITVSRCAHGAARPVVFEERMATAMEPRRTCLMQRAPFGLVKLGDFLLEQLQQELEGNV